jgi:hypothetical protein
MHISHKSKKKPAFYKKKNTSYIIIVICDFFICNIICSFIYHVNKDNAHLFILLFFYNIIFVLQNITLC